MTGYGRGTCEVGGRRLVVELRSLNHRFLEVKQRVPWSDPAVEAQLTQLLRARLDRGVVSVSVRDEGGGAAQEVRADVELARSYATALEQVRAALGLEEPVSLTLLAAQPGVLSIGDPVRNGDELWALLLPGVEKAIEGLLESRAREGAALEADLRARAATLEHTAAELRELTRDAPELSRKKLRERVERALADQPIGEASGASRGGSTEALPRAMPGLIDPARLAQEVAFLADKADVTEELTRLETHLVELKRLLGQSGPAGRRLDFLTQELNREINTIGSKSQSAQVAARVVDAKAEVERLREQIQNVE
jgi:uncharacterized protein YicC (UPF0701 family)